jgi:hypothetical protein
MPRTNVVGTTAPPGSGAQRCAQAGEREHITDRTARTVAVGVAGVSRPCVQTLGRPLPHEGVEEATS